MCCVLCYTTSDNVTSFSKTSVQTSEPFTGFHDEMQESPVRILFCDANSQVRMNYLLFLISVSLVQ
ncbi:uncharacterized protein LOC143240247 isoform X5 [Tachypleus tridentatus]|uniref:uncharacterized protein LOC143240247 isoform X5 n=1 Tax=Tachypleus tridentatus TaxID=6853 RepID=UPI003FD24151